MQAAFWISLAVLFYTYLGYGLLLSLLTIFNRRKKPGHLQPLPAITLVVPAFNEEACLEKKIENCFSLNYPAHLLSILFVTDGSTDSTPRLVAQHPALLHLHQPERRGKAAAINRAMQVIASPFVVFTDANALLHPDSLQKLVRHYSNRAVGGVSGEKRILNTDDTAISSGEGIYWKYESMLKNADASFYTVVGAAGELFSIRTALFEPLNESVILDDFVLSAKICLKGYRFAYEREAFAMETASENIKEERKRKIRISAGCFQALLLLKALLNPFRNRRLFFQYVSHRVLRWTVCPVLVPLLFMVNLFLVNQHPSMVYTVCFGLQCLFYCLAFAGWLAAAKRSFPRLFFVPYYFVFMNVSLYLGFYHFVTGRQSVLWKKAGRKPIVSTEQI